MLIRALKKLGLIQNQKEQIRFPTSSEEFSCSKCSISEKTPYCSLAVSFGILTNFNSR